MRWRGWGIGGYVFDSLLMITFQRTYDYDLIESIMTHPQLYEAAADDFAPTRESFQPRTDSDIWYILVRFAGNVIGLFALAPQNAICWEVHTRLLPAAWGPIARAAAAALVPWVWENTGCRRLVTVCPSYNRLAIRFAERGGMTRYGVNPQSWQKGGALFDQVLLGISK
jgi:RimJ/RimL family protein N-acetyltransferase